MDVLFKQEQIELCKKDFNYFIQKFCPINLPPYNIVNHNILIPQSEYHEELVYRYIVYLLLFSNDIAINILCDDLRYQTKFRVEVLKIIGMLPHNMKQQMTSINCNTCQVGTNIISYLNKKYKANNYIIILNTINPTFVDRLQEESDIFQTTQIICLGNFNTQLTNDHFKKFLLVK